MTGRVNIDVRCVELSKPVDSPLHELVARWSEAQARPCLCGGVILAKVGDPGPGVREHQSRPGHRKWATKVYG
jgi:hypothetical protein